MILQIHIDPAKMAPTNLRNLQQLQEERDALANEPGIGLQRGVGGMLNRALRVPLGITKGAFNFLIKDPFLEVKSFAGGAPGAVRTSEAGESWWQHALLESFDYGGVSPAGAVRWLNGLKKQRDAKAITQEEYERQIRGGVMTFATVASVLVGNPAAGKLGSKFAPAIASKLPAAPARAIETAFAEGAVTKTFGSRLARGAVLGGSDGAIFGASFGVMDPYSKEQDIALRGVLWSTVLGAGIGSAAGVALPFIGKGFKSATNPLRSRLTLEQREKWLSNFRDALIRTSDMDPHTRAIASLPLPETASELAAQVRLGRFNGNLNDKGVFGQLRTASAHLAGSLFNRFNEVQRRNPTLVQRAFDWLDAQLHMPDYMARKINDLIFYETSADDANLVIRALMASRFKGTAQKEFSKAAVARSELGAVQTTMLPGALVDEGKLTDELLSSVLKGEQPISYAQMRASEGRARILQQRSNELITQAEIDRIASDPQLARAFAMWEDYVQPIFETLYMRNGGKVKAQLHPLNTSSGDLLDMPFIHAIPITAKADVDAWVRGEISLYIPEDRINFATKKLTEQLERAPTDEELRSYIGEHLKRGLVKRRLRQKARKIGQTQRATSGAVETIRESPFTKEASLMGSAYHTDPNLVLAGALRVALKVDRHNAFLAAFLADPNVIPATSKYSTPPPGFEEVWVTGNAKVMEPRVRALFETLEKQYNTRHSKAATELIGVDDPKVWAERMTEPEHFLSEQARNEALIKLAERNLVNFARSNPTIKPLLLDASGNRQYISVEIGRDLFRLEDITIPLTPAQIRKAWPGQADEVIAILQAPKEPGPKDFVTKVVSGMNASRKAIRGRGAAAYNELINGPWDYPGRISQEQFDKLAHEFSLHRAAAQQLDNVETALGAADHVKQKYQPLPVYEEDLLVLTDAYKDMRQNLDNYRKSVLNALDRPDDDFTFAVADDIERFRNFYADDAAVLDNVPPHTIKQLQRLIKIRAGEVELDNKAFAALGNDPKKVEAARKIVQAKTQDYLRKELNLADKFVVFRAETRPEGAVGREHIPVATSLAPGASAQFAMAIPEKAVAGVPSPVRPFVVDMKDVLFYGPAWRETAGVGAKGFQGLAYGTTEQEIMVYADRLRPLDVPANAGEKEIREALQSQFGISQESRLARLARDKGELIPPQEVRSPRYPSMDELDVEGLGGLGATEPVLGRYFVPPEYARMIKELQTDPYRRNIAAALGFSPKTAKFLDETMPSTWFAKAWSNFMDWNVSLLLATSVEVVAHSYRILGVLSRTPVGELKGNWAALVPYWGPRAKGLVDMFHVMKTDEGMLMESRIAALGGGTNRRFLQVGHDMGTSVGSVLERSGFEKAGKALEWGRDFLFGQPESGRAGFYGFDQRARVAAAVNVNNIAKRELGRELTDAELRRFLEGFGKYNENLQNQLFALLRKSKLSPFAGGQAGMIPREIAQTIAGSPGLPKAVMDELGSRVAWQLRGEVYARGIGGTAVWLTALQYAWTGTFPWDNEKGHKLDLKVGYLEDGRAVYLPATTYMPGMSRALGLTGLRALAENANDPAKALGEAKMRMINTPITYGIAGAPGVGTAMTLLMGSAPYLNEQGQFLKVVPPQSGSGLDKTVRQGWANAVHAVTATNPTIEELFGFSFEGETLPTGVRIINALTTGLKVGREPELAVSADIRQQRAAFFEATRARVTEALATWPDNLESRQIFYRREAAKWSDPAQEQAAYLNMLRNDINIRRARARNVRRAEMDQPF